MAAVDPVAAALIQPSLRPPPPATVGRGRSRDAGRATLGPPRGAALAGRPLRHTHAVARPPARRAETIVGICNTVASCTRRPRPSPTTRLAAGHGHHRPRPAAATATTTTCTAAGHGPPPTTPSRWPRPTTDHAQPLATAHHRPRPAAGHGHHRPRPVAADQLSGSLLTSSPGSLLASVEGIKQAVREIGRRSDPGVLEAHAEIAAALSDAYAVVRRGSR